MGVSRPALGARRPGIAGGTPALLACLMAACLAGTAASHTPECNLGAGSGSGCGQLGGVTSLYRRTKAWSDFAKPLAVLQLGQPVAAAHFVPGARDSTPPRFLAVGDAAGGLHLLTPAGHLVVQHPTGTASSVTALESYRLDRNTTVLLTGHASGELRLHSLVQPPPAGGSSSGGGSSWEDGEADMWGPDGAGQHVKLSLLHVFPAESVLCGSETVPSSCSGEQAAQADQPGTCGAATAAGGDVCAPIVAVQAQGRGGTVAATAVVVDSRGRLAVLKHGGHKGGEARIVRQVQLEQTPTAVRIASSTAAAVLGVSGVASQRLGQPPAHAHDGTPADTQHRQEGEQHGPAGSAAPVFTACRGLNGSSLVAATFDWQFGTRAYALTDDGQVLSLVVGNDRAPAAGCSVRAAATLPSNFVAPPPAQQQQREEGAGVMMAVLPGYLLVMAGDRLALFNATLAPRHAPRLLLQQQLGPLRERFGMAARAARTIHQQQQHPLSSLLAVSQRSHVAFLLNSTVLAVYQADLPYRPPQSKHNGALAWLQMLQPIALVLVAAVVLTRARARRQEAGGGGGSAAAMLVDPRLREFERLLQDPMAGAPAYRRNRTAPSSWLAGDGSSGSDVEDSLLGPLPSGGRPGSAGGAALHHTGLFGRVSGKGGKGGGGAGDSTRELAARSRRAAALAADDDAAIAAMRAEVAGGVPGGSSGDDMEEDDEGLVAGAPLLGRGGRASDEVSQLRLRFGQAHIS